MTNKGSKEAAIQSTDNEKKKSNKNLKKSDPKTSTALKIVSNEENAIAMIDLNSKYLIDPSEFLTIYANQLVNEAQNSTGLAVLLFFQNINLF